MTDEALSSWRAQCDSGGWFLAQLRPNQVKRARANLERQGYRCFAPQRPSTQRRGTQMLQVLSPFFPGYLFVNIGPAQPWRPVNATYGVVRLVMRTAHTPQPVPPQIMTELLNRSDAAGVIVPLAEVAPGDTVRITAGPMAGFVARVERLDLASRVGLLLDIMGQAVRTSLPTGHLERLAG